MVPSVQIGLDYVARRPLRRYQIVGDGHIFGTFPPDPPARNRFWSDTYRMHRKLL